MRAVATRIVSVSLMSALAACSGGGSSPVSSGSGLATTPNGPTSSGPSSSAAIRYGAETTQGAALTATAPSSTVGFGVMVRMRNPTGLIQYAASANDPKSANYRHWLTPTEIANEYGAAQSDYTKVAAYFRSKGLGVASWQQRELLYVHGSLANAQLALGAQFGVYTKNGVTFTALKSAPTALTGLPITALPDASTYAAAKRVRQFVRASGGTPSSGNGYTPSQIASAFDYTGAYNAGFHGDGITIGIIGTGPISAADYALYRPLYALPGSSTVTQVNVTDAGTAGTPQGYGGQPPAGTFSAAPPATVTGSCAFPAEAPTPPGPSASCNPEDGEAQIDTEQTFGLAYNAKVLFYLGYVSATEAQNIPGGQAGSSIEGLDLYNYEIQQAINDDTADVLSLSFGEGELDDVGGDFNVTGGTVDFSTSPGPMQFASLAAEGIAVFASSGDDGNLQCSQDENPSTATSLCVAYPSIDPNVVAVGGVNSPIGVNGRLTGPLTAWGAQTGNYDAAFGASNGGVSAYFPQPTFQEGAVGVTGTTRNSPDISLEADPQTGVATLLNASGDGGILEPIGGTSVAAPESAAMWALVLQACKANPSSCKGTGTGAFSYRLGDPNPYFYSAYKTASTYADTFYDVVFGDNSQLPCSPIEQTCPSPQPTPVAGYLAGVGYDRVTGLGVPFGAALIKTITGI